MKIRFYQPTRFGNWMVQVSSTLHDGYYLLTAFNEKTQDFLMATSRSETDIVNTIRFLGEKYD